MGAYPSMLTLCGQVANVFTTPRGVNKDGEAYGGDLKVQILAHVPAEDGETRLQLIDLKTDRASEYRALQGRWVRLAVGVWSQRGAWGFYSVKGVKPEILEAPDQEDAA